MNEFKRELSKLLGVDLFNPKFRDIFNKYFPAESKAENDKLKELGIEEEQKEDVAVEKEAEVVAEAEEEVAKEPEAEEEPAEDEADKEPEPEAEKPAEEEEASNEEPAGEEEKTAEPEVPAVDNTANELLDAKIELAVIKSGVRADRVDTAKRLLRNEVQSIDDLSKIDDILKGVPEWFESKGKPKAFGMAVDERGDGLTEEERQLKLRGISL